MLLDLHTHHPQLLGTAELLQIQSLRPHEALETEYPATPLLYRSVGLHPWHEEDLTQASLLALEQALRLPHVLALGEAGLDKCCATPLPLQEDFFDQQVELAEAHRLPLILHLVRAWDELQGMKKRLHPHTPWIIHGFRGRREQARQLLGQGFYLSFGARADSEALALAYEAGRLFLETDDRPIPSIEEVYQLTADRLGCSRDQLTERITLTKREVFPFL